MTHEEPARVVIELRLTPKQVDLLPHALGLGACDAAARLGRDTWRDVEALLEDVAEQLQEGRAARPTVVCLCGSTRFWREFQAASLRETLAGRIVLSIGAATGTDDEHFGNLPPEEYARVKQDLDQLHLHKVAMADEVLILNRDGYIGDSTARELAHAFALGKRIRFLEPEMEKVNAALKRAAEWERR